MALQIDLTGQVCSDSEDGFFYSGVGGQVDFNRGASRSEGGRAIITIPSTTSDGESRIRVHLSPGAGVVVSRATVHYIVSEYGVAYLHGKSVQDRTLALISIAHPDHREQLLKDAIEARYIRQDFVDVEGKFVVAPQGMMKATYLMDNGTELYFRPIHPTDEPLMRDLLYDLSQETLYYRFMSHNQHFGHKEIQNFMKVTPHVRDDGEIYVEVNAGVGSYNPTGVLQVPGIVTREVNLGGLEVMQGDTIILGGFTIDHTLAVERRDPWLSEIPLLGYFFKSNDTEKSKNEVLFIATFYNVDVNQQN